jgi:probable HAF family extracellular repeat protein
MRREQRFGIIGVLLGVLALAFSALAQEQAQEQPKKHRHYTLVDIGTFGGPHSQVNSFSVVINPRGAVVGGASTAVPDPSCGFDAPYCFYMHAFKWKNDILTDLGTLPGGNNSFAIAVNRHQSVAGISENGLVDDNFGPAFVATLWKRDGQIVDLGTFGGAFSLPNDINAREQLAGGAENTVPDPDDLGGALIGLPSPTQWHAALWQNGIIQDLGTLGTGPASFALFVNDRGQVAGISYTSSVPNPETGIPTIDPFLWENGRMVDLGSLGGLNSSVSGLNQRGQIAGTSDVTRDGSIVHAFLWDHGSIHDLGTLGGTFSTAHWIDDSGEVVGGSTTDGDETRRAFRWKNGHMTNLGSLNHDACSSAIASNSRGQIVGNSINCAGDFQVRPFLWENGGPMVDLNSLIPAGSGLVLREAVFINEAGEIAGAADLPNGDQHAFLLIPGEGDGDSESEHATQSDALTGGLGPANADVVTPTAQDLAEVPARPAARRRGPRLSLVR